MVSNIKRVAIIGAGPAGAISIDALQQEKVFDVIRVFERSAGAGGIWYVEQHGYRIRGAHWKEGILREESCSRVIVS